MRTFPKNFSRRPNSLTACLVMLTGFAMLTPTSYAQGSAQRNATSISTSINVSLEDLQVSPPGANWPSYNGDYSGRRFSSLSQINSSNVGQLRAQWVFHVKASSDLEVTPVAADGILFISAANEIGRAHV